MNTDFMRKGWTAKVWQPGILLLVALIHGLVYVFIMPPWQHHDEPKHFERVWLTANLDRPAQPGDADPELSLQVMRSMVANDFFAGAADQLPDLTNSTTPIKIAGFDQSGEPPLYYWAAALPLRLMRRAPVERQLIAARLVSLCFFLITILAAWGTGQVLFPPGSALRWMLPMSAALLPAFVDLMTAVNNDVAAVATFSCFLWSVTSLVQRGLTGTRLTAVLLTAGLTYFSKNTAWIALGLAPLAILLAVARGAWRRWAWLALCVGAVAGAVGILRWDDALYWYKSTTQPAPIRQSHESSVLGEQSFLVSTRYPRLPKNVFTIYQLLPLSTIEHLQGKTVTLGAWMWASEPVEAYSPRLDVISKAYWKKASIDQAPQFVAFQVELPAELGRGFVALDPYLSDNSLVKVYYDGVILVEGAYPLDQIPYFTDPGGRRGEWGGQPFTNLLRNASAETPGPRFLPRFDQGFARLLPQDTRPGMLATSVIDWEATGDFYVGTARFLVQSFWARFGWAHVRLIIPEVYVALTWLTVLCLVGAGIALVSRKSRIDSGVWFIVLLAVMISWGATLTRGMGLLGMKGLYLPPARHSYPVILPTLLVICLGWRQSTDMISQAIAWIQRSSRRSPIKDDAPGKAPAPATTAGKIDFSLVLFSAFFLALAVLSILSILRFYSGVA